MSVIYPVTFVMSAVLIFMWTLSHYDDDNDDDTVKMCEQVIGSAPRNS